MRVQHLRRTVPVTVIAAGSLLIPTVLMAPTAGAAHGTVTPGVRVGVTAKGPTSSSTSTATSSKGSSTRSSKSNKSESAPNAKKNDGSNSTKNKNAKHKSAATTNAGVSSGAAAGFRAHIVRSSDSVASIAKQYGVSADSVRAANGIVNDALYLGARVIIDGSAGSASTGASSKNPTPKGSSSDNSSKGSKRSNDSTDNSSKGSKRSKRIASKSAAYTIEDGDTLSGIADDHGVTLKALLAANDLKVSSLILPGDKVAVPGSSGSSSSTASSSTASSSTATGSSGSDATASSTSGSSSVSYGPDLRCPVPGATFMNDWGFPRDGGGRFHEGTDMFARKGATIVAPAAGTLVFSKGGRGGNTFIIQTASGWEIYGAHMNSTIGSSRSVKAGEAIGTVGNTGNAAGGDTHLHMGLKRIGGRAMNPYPSVRSACG